MSFIVILSTFMFIFTKINGCPLQQRPCKTVNGTRGSCIQAKDCSYINALNDDNLTPDKIDFIKKSVCGIDLDRSTLICCDNNAIRNSGEQANQKVSPGSIQQESVQNIQYVTTPATTTTVKPPVQDPVYCRTPNGEKAECVSIYQCSNFISNVSPNTTQDQRRFLKESVCGYENTTNKPLVCCGSDVNFRENGNEGNKLEFRKNPLIPVDSCGIQNFTIPNRIFGGADSELGEFPWTALLVYETNDGKKMFVCGGSLISSRYVLTAAHCVSRNSVGSELQLTGVRLGEWDYGNKGRDCLATEGGQICNEAEVTVGVQSIHRYPEYQEQSKEKYHDIALIRLDRDVKFTNFIRPICLPNVDEYISPGERLTISGWGLVNYNQETTIKQKVEVPAVSRSQCSLMFERSPRLTQVGKGQFCAGGEDGKDACVGDSGAPLMRNLKSNFSDSDQWFLEGIVSFGSACGLVNRYGVYTKVSEYVGWIHNTMVP